MRFNKLSLNTCLSLYYWYFYLILIWKSRIYDVSFTVSNICNRCNYIFLSNFFVVTIIDLPSILFRLSVLPFLFEFEDLLLDFPKENVDLMLYLLLLWDLSRIMRYQILILNDIILLSTWIPFKISLQKSHCVFY